MRQAILLVFFVTGSLFLQSTLLQALLPSSLVPHLTVLPVVYLAFSSVGVLNVFASFAIGLLVDLSSAMLLGPYAGGYVAAYGCIAILSQRLFIESPLVAALVSGAASLLADILFYLISYEFRPVGISFIGDVFVRAIVTAVMGPLILALMRRTLVKRGASRSVGIATA